MVLVVVLDMVVEEGMHIMVELISRVALHMEMLSCPVNLVVEVEMRI